MDFYFFRILSLKMMFGFHLNMMPAQDLIQDYSWKITSNFSATILNSVFKDQRENPVLKSIILG
jgi:hypothetical protein